MLVRNFAVLGRQFKGNLITVRLTDNDFLLVNNVNSVNQNSDIETFLFNNVFAHNLGKDDILDDTGLNGFGVGQINGDVKGSSDQRYAVGLGLVFLSANLVFSLSVTSAITSSFAICYLHGFRLLFIGHLKIYQNDIFSFRFMEGVLFIQKIVSKVLGH